MPRLTLVARRVKICIAAALLRESRDESYESIIYLISVRPTGVRVPLAPDFFLRWGLKIFGSKPAREYVRHLAAIALTNPTAEPILISAMLLRRLLAALDPLCDYLVLMSATAHPLGSPISPFFTQRSQMHGPATCFFRDMLNCKSFEALVLVW